MIKIDRVTKHMIRHCFHELCWFIYFKFSPKTKLNEKNADSSDYFAIMIKVKEIFIYEILI